MEPQAEITLARQKVILAEEALYAMLQRRQVDNEECRRLAMELASARDILLTQLAMVSQEN